MSPLFGSHRELGLSSTWMTADGRYGPYGFGEDDPTTYKRSRVDWDLLDWGELVDQCLEPASRHESQHPAMPRPMLKHSKPKRFKSDDHPHTTRTALVLRSYEGFNYTEEVMWMIRSLITEASLKTGGRYSLILLVNVQDKGWAIHESPEHYQRAFQAMHIPPELWSLTLLWDENLLESWYPLATEHRTMWQVNQPLQLLAHHYPEYDHFWQLEMDQRFMGDALEYLDAVHTFSLLEPRKQALERATYPYIERNYKSYDDFINQVSLANNGGSRAWPALRIPDVEPIGPEPPTPHPEDTRGYSSYGLGEEADVVLTSFCEDVRDVPEWVFNDWYRGELTQGSETPRFFCPPAIARASRKLLGAVHEAQVRTGISVPSEATLPSWALWLGLKLSYPPQPVYMQPAGGAVAAPAARVQEDYKEEEEDESFTHEDRFEVLRTLLGDRPFDSRDGLAHAKPQSFASKGLTYWWASDYPRQVMDAWMGDDTNDMDARAVAPMLVEHDGQVYAPNFVMHPVK
ncbi:Protein of unknown function (DUF3405) [Geosmithia morbida]|uniref:Uncharacterized protein n=1 Tax=Geosmithia morbida TaxID=1094350 RepID=A0A9P5D3U4_9HYPO|nr:Protein of unknown function (DUF3405) [Geosmithia morbida]KAF4122866.1 Protein of unknown function (DUF3405) [Geosmithia morbida]